MNRINASRRKWFKSTVFGLFALPFIPKLMAEGGDRDEWNLFQKDSLFYRYPALDDQRVREVVSASHGRFETVKKLVKQRPELAYASWDWGFGDWESALGAASHMGRRDIAEFLISYGARPDIFTFAMMGALETVKSMIESVPGIQQKQGPHGITLLQHTKNRLRHDNLNKEDRNNVIELQKYLQSLGDSDLVAESLEVSKENQKIYFGEYRFGDKEDEIFIVDLNMRKMLQIARKGTFGRVMNRIGEHRFSPGGATSVEISFVVQANKAVSLTVHEPEPFVTAIRI